MSRARHLSFSAARLAVCAAALGLSAAAAQAPAASRVDGPPAAAAAEAEHLAAEAERHALAIARAVASGDTAPGPHELARLAVANANDALRLDARQLRAHLAAGLVARQFWHWDEAQKAFARAYALAPEDASVSFNYVWFSAFTGQHERAVAIAEKGVMLRPSSAAAWRDLGIAEAYAGHVDAAARALDRCTELDAGLSVCYIYLGVMETRRGRLEAGEAALRRAEALFGEAMSAAGASSLAHAYYRAGLAADAARIVGRLESMAAAGRVVGAGSWPLAQLAVGRVDAAYAALREAVARSERHEPDEGFYNLMIIKANVQANPVLDEDRFAALRARIGGN